jgi:NADPH2:quinone reductase
VAYTGTGGYAEYAVTKSSDALLVPDGIDSVTAAAVPTVYLTAWFGLLTAGKLIATDALLVQAGSSGVGIAAIQIAKHLGARVITTSGGKRKCERLRKIGADETIDSTTQDFVAEVKRITNNGGVDVVFEMLGGEVYKKSLEVLAPNGRLVSIGGAFGAIPDSPPALSEGRTATRFSITNYLNTNPGGFKQLGAILTLVKEKKLQVIIDKTFPLAEARAAQRYLEGREHFGKIVLTV